MRVRVLILPALIAAAASATSVPSPSDEIVEHYCAATKRQAQMLTSASMEVDISGAIPKLKKQGKLHALRRITSLGRITFEALKFQGDDTVKKNVIARYLQQEEQSQQDPSIAVTPDNYRFKYKGKTLLDGREAHLFDVSPKKKREGLFRGQVWIDAQTYLRVQETGQLVKNPSFMLRKVQFVRKYEIRDGLSVPVQLQSVANVLIVGRVELTVSYTNFSADSQHASEGDYEAQ